MVDSSRVAFIALLALGAAACWRTGEPTPSRGLVTWAAYPESVQVGEVFSFEFAGPISLTACGRLDTAYLAITESRIRLSADRSTFRAVCANQRISFYEARAIRIPAAGRYEVTTAEGMALGALVATDSGPFSRMRALGEGTIRSAGGCWLFGPGWAGNQRPFALLGAPRAVTEEAGSDRVVHVEGTLRGFTMCDWYGSRPSIRVDTAWVTDRTSSDYYDGDDEG
jgi:hypothetical protein